MSRPKIVAGNWKMNTNLPEAIQLASAVAGRVNDADGVVKILIPPFPFLTETKKAIEHKATLHLGAQNCSTHDKGAYTGEIAAGMLKSTGCKYVLVGHSERRQYFHETHVDFVKKAEQAFLQGLTPIYCIGETLEQRKNGSHYELVKNQVKEVLGAFKPEQIGKFILAYEPVWAIGTGETATSAQAQDMHAHIRMVLAELFDKTTAQQMPVLYGGSCNAQNAPELFACADVDGGLIGGASLKADDFCRIIDSF